MNESEFKSRFKIDFAKHMRKNHDLVVRYFEIKTGHRSAPDTLVLCGKSWGLLEFKESKDADHRPNQDYWVGFYNEMGYSSFVYPENAKEVWDGLEAIFASQ